LRVLDAAVLSCAVLNGMLDTGFIRFFVRIRTALLPSWSAGPLRSCVLSLPIICQTMLEQHNIRTPLPLLVLWVLAADNVDIFAALSPHTLAALAQLLDTTPHLHTAHLLLSGSLG
jgi:hypothetical protein